MYPTRIVIDQVELHLCHPDGSPRMWTVLVGKGADQVLRGVSEVVDEAPGFFVIRLEESCLAQLSSEVDVPDEEVYLDTLNRILGTGKNALFPGLRVGGRPSQPLFFVDDKLIEGSSLPDDHQIVLSMLFKIVDRMARSGTDEGLVILGEFGLGLFPETQLVLVHHLRQVLPKVQFVVKTRSPLVLSSFSRREVVSLRRNAKSGLILTCNISHKPSPMMLTGKEIVETWLDGQGPTSSTMNPLGRDRRAVAGALVMPDPMLNDYVRKEAMRRIRKLSKTLGPPEHWLEESELRRLAEFKARAAP